jgi:Leucine-rich repeat (LRR) protein
MNFIFGNLNKKEEKKLIEFIKPVDPSIKSKLQGMASSGFSASQPRLITMELIAEAIAEYKQEKQIFSLEITQTNCSELALSFKKILQISNLENLINVHTLRLDNNMIMRIENLSKLKNIKWLDLSFNYISEIEGLDALENLTDLSLYCNQITEVKNLDKNRKLNVLSVGYNQILDCKPMAKYLKRFSNLQALCCHMNPFCRDEESVQKLLEENKSDHRFPGSYDPIITGLLGLKYLDWKPIDEDYREKVINNSISQGKEDKEAKEAENEEKLMEERAALHNADLDEIIDFFPRVIENIKEEIANGVTWESLMILPGLKDQINLAEKGINEDLDNYKEEILEKQKEKDEVINKKKKELDANEEKFIVKSKEMIRAFKKVFKKFCKDLKEGKLPNIKTQEEGANYVGLQKLKDDLLEIEIYEKEQLNSFIKGFREEVRKINDVMQGKTNVLREKLDSKKVGLKEKIDQITAEIKAKTDAYENEKNEEGKEGEETEKTPKDSNLDELYRIVNSGEFISDKDKVTEILDDRISKLKDSLDNARTISTENYFANITNNDYYRNKKRIEDITEIYSMYYNKIKEELDKAQKANEPDFH